MSEYRVTNNENQVYRPAPASPAPSSSGTNSSGTPTAIGAPAVQPQAQEAPVQAVKNDRALVQQPPPKPTPQESEKAALPITNTSNVFLKFKVDEDTRNITVYVIDRETKRVLRSIPPEEMNKLQTGDLLELIA
jgi:uncharacterized FlaG/YvyC family protein